MGAIFCRKKSPASGREVGQKNRAFFDFLLIKEAAQQRNGQHGQDPEGLEDQQVEGSHHPDPGGNGQKEHQQHTQEEAEVSVKNGTLLIIQYLQHNH